MSGGGGAGGTGGAGGGAPATGCGRLTLGDPSGNLLDIGLSEATTLLRSGNRVLGFDGPDNTMHWALFDTDSRSIVLSGDYAEVPLASMKGNRILNAFAHSIELRDASDGHVITTVPTQTVRPSSGLSADASYFYTTDSGLDLYDANTGALVLHRDGAYGSGVYAGAGEVRVAGGPNAPSAVEIIPTSGANPTITAPYGDTFHLWFVDGEHFLTSAGSTVRVYTKDATQAALGALPTTTNLAGTGDFFWTYDPVGDLTFYAIANPNSPPARSPRRSRPRSG